MPFLLLVILHLDKAGITPGTHDLEDRLKRAAIIDPEIEVELAIQA